MQINQVQRLHKNKKHVKIGRGGVRGKYSGKGIKGQKARSGHRMRPEMRDIIKHLPKLRGHGKNRAQSVVATPKPAVVNVAILNEVFEAGTVITPVLLHEKKLIRRQGGVMPLVKVLGTGEVAKKLMIEGCEVSAAARAKIEKAGGAIVAAPKREVKKS